MEVEMSELNFQVVEKESDFLELDDGVRWRLYIATEFVVRISVVALTFVSEQRIGMWVVFSIISLISGFVAAYLYMLFWHDGCAPFRAMMWLSSSIIMFIHLIELTDERLVFLAGGVQIMDACLEARNIPGRHAKQEQEVRGPGVGYFAI